MPFPNEHAARQKSPNNYKEFRRNRPKGFPDGVDVIWGIKIDAGKRIVEMQSIRFESSKWTVYEARTWLKEHGFKTTIEAAIKIKKSFWAGVLFD